MYMYVYISINIFLTFSHQRGLQMFDESSRITQKVTVHISLTNMTHFTHLNARPVFATTRVFFLTVRSRETVNVAEWKKICLTV